MKRMFIAALLFGLCALLLSGCPSAGAGGQPEIDDPAPSPATPSQLLSAIPVTNASIPLSMQRARGDFSASGALFQSLEWSAYGPPAQDGIVGLNMKDLMINWLLDLSLVETPGAAHVLISALLDAVNDPDASVSYDTPFAVGVRTVPENNIDVFAGIDTMDFGSITITEASATEKIVYWALNFNFGEGPVPVFIQLNIGGNPVDMLVTMRVLVPAAGLVFYEQFGTGGRWTSINVGEGESNAFRQYTDEDGFLRTLFSGYSGGALGDPDYSEFLALMIGNEESTGMYVYKRQPTPPENTPVNATSEALRFFESYNSEGQLLMMMNPDSPENELHQYPLMTMNRAGFTLVTNGGSAAWQPDTGTEQAITGTVADDTTSFHRWTSEKIFDPFTEKVLKTTAPLANLDSSNAIATIQQSLDAWMTELAAETEIDGVTKILTINPDHVALANELVISIIEESRGNNLFPVLP